MTLGDNYDLTFEGAEFTITAGFEMNVFPNPFTDHVTFEFDLNSDADVLLELYNVIGVKIATIFTGFVTAGPQHFEYFPEHLSEGVFIYRLSIDGDPITMGKIVHKK